MKNDRFNLIVYIKQLNKCFNDILINYPRCDYVLKDRIVNDSFELLDLAYYANVLDNRLIIQKKMLCKVSVLDYYMEISYERKYINLRKLNFITNKLDVIKKLIYGWIKSCES